MAPRTRLADIFARRPRPEAFVEATLAMDEPEAVSPADFEQAEAQLLAMTLADTGPDPDRQPSKLFTSRAEFQAALPLRENLSSVDLDDITDAIDRLTSHHRPSSPEGIAGPSTRSPSRQARRVPAPYTRFLLERQQRESPEEQVITQQLSALRSISAEVARLVGRIESSISGSVAEDVLKAEISKLVDAFKSINRQADVVQALKKEVGVALDNLGLRFTQWRLAMRGEEDYLFFDSGEL